MIQELKEKLNEQKIKEILISSLLTKKIITNETTIINELPIEDAKRRIDLAIINKGKITAYEIKSDFDTLNRLEGQVHKYLEYCDKVVVISTKKHIHQVLTTLPENIEVLLIENSRIKVAKRGKSITPLEKSKNINLADRKELSRVVSIKTQIKDKMSRYELEQIALTASAKKLRAVAISTLIKKYELTSRLFMKKFSEERKINLEHLSRHRKKIENSNSIISLIREGKLN